MCIRDREMRRLENLLTQRTAKLQVMREVMREVDWYHAVSDKPEMRYWFDEDGVPK